MISIDVETTGLDPERHEVWEVGAVDLRDNAEHWYEFPVRRLREADPGALKINNYYWNNSVAPGDTQAMSISGIAMNPRDAAFELARLTSGETLLGCAVHFDALFLGNLLRFYDAAPAWRHRHLDLGSFAAGVMGKSKPMSSAEMARDLIENDDPHSALGDARWNVEVYRTLQAIRKERQA